MNKILVTVVIITHNRSKLLKKAINSVLVQTYKNIEIVVVDDYSSDETQNIMEEIELNTDSLRYVRLEKPSGANIARNKGINEATGEYVTGLDDDDEMLPSRIEKMLYNYDDKYAYVSSQVYFVNNSILKKKDFLRFKQIITLNDMLYTNCTGNQVFTKKQMLIDAGLYDEELVSAQDYDMWIRLLLIKPRAKMIKEPLMLVDRNDFISRISASNRKISGYFKVYKKYKKFMKKDHKKFQLFKLYLQKNKKLSFRLFFLFMPKNNLLQYLYINIKIIIKK